MPTYTPADLVGMWAYLFVVGNGLPRGELLVEAYRAVADPPEAEAPGERTDPPPPGREREVALSR